MEGRTADIIVTGTLPRTTPARFGLIWFSGFRGKDLNVIFHQNMPNLHNRYKSTERKISQKNPEWRVGLSDIIVKRTLPTRFGLIWFNGFRGKDFETLFP
jgi:hypothetical protein